MPSSQKSQAFPKRRAHSVPAPLRDRFSYAEAIAKTANTCLEPQQSTTAPQRETTEDQPETTPSSTSRLPSTPPSIRQLFLPLSPQ
eukprot:GSA25T00025570001.1